MTVSDGSIRLEGLPAARPMNDVLDASLYQLRAIGFDPATTLAMIGVCRDELTEQFSEAVHEHWGHAFDMSSLAGMLLLGRTGMQAAMHHAPDGDGHRRYVAFLMPHIGVDASGTVGRCERRGQIAAGSACGALVALQAEFASGTLSADLDPGDIEYSLLRQRMIRELAWGHVPDLTELTATALHAIIDDFDVLAQQMSRHSGPVDIALVSGVLVHGPGGREFIAPGPSWISLDGERSELQIGSAPAR